MGNTDELSGQVVYIMPGGWITSDFGMAARAWHQHERMSDPGTVPAQLYLNPPTRLYRPTSGTLT